MENCVLKQIYVEENTPLRVCITVEDNSVEILLFQEEKCWNSSVAKENLQHFANEHKLTIENYCQNLLEYIKTSSPDIKYVFNSEEFIINRLLKGSLTVKYFICKVQKTRYVEHVEQIMDKFYFENLKLLENVNIFKKANEELTDCKNQCELKLKQLVAQKKSDESEQFGQFLLILNEKKRRIQHLTELLEVFKKGRPISNPEVKVGKQKSKKGAKNSATVQKKETISESESDDDDDESSLGHNTTDDESIEKSKSASPIENKPSTSTETFDFLEDDIAQSHMLPKRAKHSKPEENIVVVPKSPPKTEEVETQQQARSPGIDLSTQQLLDML
ncbi:uncharacterized protein LOC135133955 [Zophobas morio]|uniref:uncharacterized protein LOC135133955 n=1 Tax=Zophobas morio TaxID=2755281 RepID=UPI003082FF94